MNTADDEWGTPVKMRKKTHFEKQKQKQTQKQKEQKFLPVIIQILLYYTIH